MNLQKENIILVHTPAFAKFILENHLEQYVIIQSEISLDLNLPILKFFLDIPEPELKAYSMETSAKFLKDLADNRAYEGLQQALSEWENNQLVYLQQDQIQLDDLLLISLMRKRTLARLLKIYTSDIDLTHSVIAELDNFFINYDRATVNIYVQLLRERIEEDSYFRQKLTNTSPGFYYIYDMIKDRQIQPSHKLFDYLGYNFQDYSGNDQFFRGLIHPEDKSAAEVYLMQVKKVRDNEVTFFEYRLREKNGNYKWMRNYESVYKRDENNIPQSVIGVAFDISKERQITEQLISREEELLEAQELANMGSYIWGLDGRNNFVTPQASKILGLNGEKLEEFVQKIHPSDRQAVKNAIDKALTGEENFDIEYRCIVKGEEKVVWGRGEVKFENNKPVVMKGTIMDVTHRKHMIKQLRRSEELYKQAQELNKLGNWTWEIQTDTLHWSDELYRIYGIEPQSEEINLNRFISFIHPEDRPGRFAELEAQMKDAAIKDYYFRIISADGQQKILYGQSQVLLDENKVPYKMVGTCQDVTKQKELENSLYKKTQQLEQSNARLEEFAYISSHDLKEPLRKIALFADRLRIINKGSENDSLRTVEKIIDGAKRMQTIIDDILTLSRINADESYKECNLSVVLSDVLYSLDYAIEESKAGIEVDKLPILFANETQMRQLFMNLLSNSLKFRRAGIQPLITINYNLLQKEDILSLKLDSSREYIRILIKDNGIGFENDFAEKIFTIFQRLHTKDKYEGTGIGLAICKKIAEHHEGIIYAKGIPGKCAEFIVILPSDLDRKHNSLNFKKSNESAGINRNTI